MGITEGLDQFLYARLSIAADTEVARMLDRTTNLVESVIYADDSPFEELTEALGVTPENPHISILRNFDGSFEVMLCVGRWQKANQIHAWVEEHFFFDKKSKGLLSQSLTRDDLARLRDTCTEVLEDPAKLGPELLPTLCGPSFGDYEYSTSYVADLTETVHLLSEVLSQPGLREGKFYYRASW